MRLLELTFTYQVLRAHYDIATFLSQYTALHHTETNESIISKSAQATSFQHLNRRKCLIEDKLVVLTFEFNGNSDTTAIKLNQNNAIGIVNDFVLEITSGYSNPKTASVVTQGLDMVEQVRFLVPGNMQEICIDFVVTSPMTTSEAGHATKKIQTVGSSSALLSLTTSSCLYTYTKEFARIPLLASNRRHIGRIDFRYLVVNPILESQFFTEVPIPWDSGGLKVLIRRFNPLISYV